MIPQKIKIIEFPGFSGDVREDNKIKESIKKYIRTVKEIKLICFAISGNETRLTEDLKNMFSNVYNIFALDIINNYIFIITNCTAMQSNPYFGFYKRFLFSKIFTKANG